MRGIRVLVGKKGSRKLAKKRENGGYLDVMASEPSERLLERKAILLELHLILVLRLHPRLLRFPCLRLTSTHFWS